MIPFPAHYTNTAIEREREIVIITCWVTPAIERDHPYMLNALVWLNSACMLQAHAIQPVISLAGDGHAHLDYTI